MKRSTSVRRNGSAIEKQKPGSKKYMRKLFTIFFFIAFCCTSYSQQNDTALINALIKDIAASQVKADGEFYKGMFPSFRECGGSPHNYQPDNNIFFTAISAFALRNMLPTLSYSNQKIVRDIIEKASSAYTYYKDQFGDPFYNFWPTHAPIMPHTYYFKYLKSVFGQGEDADDTVMILMTDDNDDSANTVVKKRLVDVANKSNGRNIISTYKKYKDIPAYSTYLGTRMTPDFDFAVGWRDQYQPVTDQVATRGFFDEPARLQVVHPFLIGGNEHVCLAARFDLARQHRACRER